MQASQEIKFVYSYNYAAYARKLIFENKPEEHVLERICYDDAKLLKPHKETTLHDFLEYLIRDEFEYSGRKFEMTNDWESILKDYKIKFSKAEAKRLGDDYDSYLTNKMITNLVTPIANETFQLLFSDRMFCLKFNELIASEVKKGLVADDPQHYSKDGILHRCTSFNQWVCRAVFMRERGHCAICLTDLSGVFFVDFQDNIDHIVPLKLGGNNDITNLQLVCKTCNLRKLDHTIRTGEIYPTYF